VDIFARNWWIVVVSHFCDRKKSQRWGTGEVGGLGYEKTGELAPLRGVGELAG
jgi:hypothetical protein